MKGKLLSSLILATCLCPLSIAQGQSQPGDYGQPNGAGYPQYAPPELTLPVGTLITVRTTELLSSDKNRPGDLFTAILEQPLVAQGWVVSRFGQTVQGRIAVAEAAGRVQGVSRLAVELSGLALVDGLQVPVRTELVQNSAGTSHASDAAEIGAMTGIGAAIGAGAGRGMGAAIGAAAGAAAGVAGVLATRGRPTELYPETVLTFRLQDPVTISTRQSQQAFQPVNQSDYNNMVIGRNPPPYPAADAYPPPPYYYPYGYWNGYPPYGYDGYYGYYGYYGRGPGIYVVPRVYIGPGYRRRR